MDSMPESKTPQSPVTKTEWRPVLVSLVPAFLLGVAIMAIGYLIWWGRGLNPDSEVPSFFGLAMVFVLQRWTFRLWKGDRARFWLVFALSVVLVLCLFALRLAKVVQPPT
jgi:hypothetical protein